MRRPILATGLAIILAAALLGVVSTVDTSAEERAQSGLVSVGDGVVIIDVPIEFSANRHVPGADAPPIVEAQDAHDWAAKLEADVEQFLNDAFKAFAFEDCYRFQIDIRTNMIDWYENTFTQEGEWAQAHRINLSFDPGHRSMTYTASDTGLASRDDAKAWEFYSSGEWAYFDMSPSDYAHEVMHMFGLGDDYRPVYGPDGQLQGAIDRPGREGTLMDSGDLLDQDLVDRLGKLLREAEELPNCWVANIDLDTHQRLVSGDTCDVTGHAEGKVLVASNGEISGVLDAQEVESCTFGFDRTRSDLTLALAGTASESDLTLHHTGGETTTTTTGYYPFGFITEAGGLDPVPVPITGPGHAEGSVTRQHPNDMTVTLTFDLECLTCRPAVG